MTKNVIYISVDMEADGPVPGENSMLSLGADARLPDGTKLATYSENLVELPGTKMAEEAMRWWAQHPQAWQATRTAQRDPYWVMLRFSAWVKHLEQTHEAEAIFVAYPVSFDFDYVRYYSRKFLGIDIFEGRCVDMRSMAMGILGVDYGEANKAHMPAEWNAMEHMTHVAVEDAIQQADLFFKMIEASRRK